jgi:hypothetical protein
MCVDVDEFHDKSTDENLARVPMVDYQSMMIAGWTSAAGV